MPRITRRSFIVLAGGAAVAAVAVIGGFGLYEGMGRSSITSSTAVSESGSGSTTGINEWVPDGSKYSQNIQSAVNYLTQPFNSQLNLIAQGTNNNQTPVKFYFFNGDLAPSLSSNMTFEPMECWKQAWCAIEFPLQQDLQMGYKVLAALDGLKTSVGWVHNMKDTPLLGIPIGYDFPNSNMTFTPNSQPEYPTINGMEYAIDQAARFDLSTLKWIPWNDKPYTNALGWNPSAIDFTLFSALNFALRRRIDLAQQNIDAVAQHFSMNSDGSVLLGSSPSRGMFLGVFLYVCTVLSYFPALPDSIQFSDIESSMWNLQQNNGAIARNYSNFSSMANGDNETTSAAVLPYCSKLIQYVRQTLSSSQYDLDSEPPQRFMVNPF